MCVHVCVECGSSLRDKGVGRGGLSQAVPSHPWKESLKVSQEVLWLKGHRTQEPIASIAAQLFTRWATPSQSLTSVTLPRRWRSEGGQARCCLRAPPPRMWYSLQPSQTLWGARWDVRGRNE